VIATMAVPVRKVETQRLQQMQMLAYPGHRHIEEPGWFLQAQRRGADRRSTLGMRCPRPPAEGAPTRQTTDSLVEQEGFELVVPPRKGVAISSPTRRAGGPPGWL
jgi:hypothetical protein